MTEIKNAKIVRQTKNRQEAKPEIRTIESELIEMPKMTPESLAKGINNIADEHFFLKTHSKIWTVK